MNTTNTKYLFILLLLISFIWGCSSVPVVQTIILEKDPNFSDVQPEITTNDKQETTVNSTSVISADSSDLDALYEQKLDELKKLYRSRNFTVPPVATVMNFDSQGVSDMDARFISDYLSSALYNTKSFRIIDRNQRETLLQELSFSLSGCSDESCQLEAGRLLSADKIIVGNLGKISSRFIIDVRMIDVTSGETVSVSNNIYNSMDELLDDSRFIALNLTEEFLKEN